MSVSITAIAKELGISRATVSNALAGRGRMRQDLRKKILSCANKYSYRPNVNAARLRRGKSDQILFGALIEKTEIFDFNHAILIHYLTNKLMKLGYDLVIHPFEQNKESWNNIVEKVRNKSVDGVVLQLDASLVPELIQDLVKTKAPVAIYDSSADAMDNSLVDTVTCSFLDNLIQSFKNKKLPPETEVFCIVQNEVYDDRLVQDFINVAKIYNLKNINPEIRYDSEKPEFQEIWQRISEKTSGRPAVVLFRTGNMLDKAFFELRSTGIKSLDNIHIYSLKHNFDTHAPDAKRTSIMVSDFENITELLIQNVVNRIENPDSEISVNILPGKII